MEMVISVILITVGLILLLVLICNSKTRAERMSKAFEFRMKLLNMASQCNLRNILQCKYSEENDAYTWFYDKYTMIDFVNSNKPLELKYWYTEEEISKILGDD